MPPEGEARGPGRRRSLAPPTRDHRSQSDTASRSRVGAWSSTRSITTSSGPCVAPRGPRRRREQQPREDRRQQVVRGCCRRVHVAQQHLPQAQGGHYGRRHQRRGGLLLRPGQERHDTGFQRDVGQHVAEGADRAEEREDVGRLTPESKPTVTSRTPATASAQASSASSEETCRGLKLDAAARRNRH